MVSLQYEDTEILDLDPEFFISLLDHVCNNEGKSLYEIAIVFCSDEFLLDINNRFLNHDYYTDIITFDYVEDEKISGDLMISIDRVKDNALTEGVGFKEELNRVVIHGVLHLLGYDDKSSDEALLMREKEAFYLGFT